MSDKEKAENSEDIQRQKLIGFAKRFSSGAFSTQGGVSYERNAYVKKLARKAKMALDALDPAEILS